MKPSEYLKENEIQEWTEVDYQVLEKLDKNFISKEKVIELIKEAKILNQTEKLSMSTLAHNQILQGIIKEVKK